MAKVGRPPGSKNKRTLEVMKRDREVVDAAAAAGETPLQYLLGVMRNRENTDEVRLDAAKAAAPYVHARLNAVEAKITHRDEMNLEELRRAIARDLAAIGIQGAAFAGADGEAETVPEGRPN